MYKLAPNNVVVKLSSDTATPELFIPMDPANSDYQQYLNWLNQGNTPIDEDVPYECINPTDWSIDQNCYLAKLKDRRKVELNLAMTSHIYSYYPEDKQKYDEKDESYWTNYLKVYNVDEVAFRTQLVNSVTAIYNGTSDFATEFNNFLTAFPVPVDANNNPIADPTKWERAIDQLLKIAIRNEFIQRVKEEGSVFEAQIDSATTVDEIKAITFTFNTVLPI